MEKCYQQKDLGILLLSPIHHGMTGTCISIWHPCCGKEFIWREDWGSRWFCLHHRHVLLLTGVVYLFLEFALAEFLNEPDFKRIVLSVSQVRGRHISKGSLPEDSKGGAAVLVL